MTPTGDLAFDAAMYAYQLGDSVGPRLVDLCQDQSCSSGVREYACTSLGKIGFKLAIPTLLKLLDMASDVTDSGEIIVQTESRIAQAAAEALSRIDPYSLIDLPGRTAKEALRSFALVTGALVFEKTIFDRHGRNFPKADF